MSTFVPPKKPTLLKVSKSVLVEDQIRNASKQNLKKGSRAGAKYVRKLIPMSELAEEIFGDILDLMKEFPTGIRIADLMEYYGESSARCLVACQLLDAKGRINLFKNHANVYQIKSIDTPHTSIDNLTPLQKKCVEFVHRCCVQHGVLAVRTNYAQVARQIESSFVGIQAIVHRCALNGFIVIDQKSVRGQSDALILRIVPHMLPEKMQRILRASIDKRLKTPTTSSPHQDAGS